MHLQELINHVHIKRYRPAIFFALGFLFDILTLNEVDNLLSLIQQCFYILIAGLVLRWAFLQQEGLWAPPESWHKFWPYHNELVHFLLGGLLSIYTLFFFVSSSFSVSFLFLLLLFSLLILNETPLFQKKSLAFKYLLYSLCLFSFFLFVLPLLAGSISVWAFYAALLVSSLLILMNFLDTYKKGVEKNKIIKQMVLPGGIVALAFLLFYHLKILPPVPLSAKYMGIYHNISKSDERYQLEYNRPWWRFWQNGDQTFYAKAGDKIYCFARVFAPGLISEKILFHWQFYQNGQWLSQDRVAMQLKGGRQHGFRAYAVKSNYSQGEWRVMLETEDGREISRIHFEVIPENSAEEREFSYDFH